ncbi:MAG TPA: hypothetical protein VMV89_07710 [Candidatus Paceibacterota bacterium]|nr:hypothetical protein [Candidatus Paceibacterota bacterium]
MIAKPTIGWINSDGEILFINDVTVVFNAMTDNVLIYKDPDPPLADVKLALDNYSTAVYLPNPSPVDTLNKNNLRLVLANKVRSLSYYVAKACNGDLGNLILSGFPPQKGKGQPIGIPAQPQGLTVSHGPQLSQLVARVGPTFGAVIYNYRLLANTPGAAPVVVQDTAGTHTFAGLIAGVKYTIDVSASGTGGTMSDWSGAISLTAD